MRYKHDIRTKIGQTYQKFRLFYLRLRGYDISTGVRIEREYNFDRYNPKGIHIGKNTLISSHVTILAHKFIPKNNMEYSIGENIDTFIGDGCFIGTGSFIMSGIKIGDYCVVGAASVVTRDIPSNCIVAGNPARIIKNNITMHDIKL
jgi:acetyltransferase-like isoleucine patch superfamily enzyme